MADHVLRVVMLDTFRTRLAIIHEGEHMPYRRRLVSITLTAEQVEALRPREVGEDGGRPVFEEIGPAWLEVERG